MAETTTSAAGFSSIESSFLPVSTATCTRLHLPIGMLYPWKALLLAKVSHHGPDFLKPENRALRSKSLVSYQFNYNMFLWNFCSMMPKNVVCPNLKGSNIQKVRCTYIGWFTIIVHSMHAVKSLSFDICFRYRIIFFNSSDGAQDLSGRWLLYSKLSEPWCLKERVDLDESFNSQPLSPMSYQDKWENLNCFNTLLWWIHVDLLEE